MADAVVQAQLRVGAHVLVQLGRELVTDPEQALLELVKNAYDADSRRCSILVDTHETGTLRQIGSAERLLRFAENSDAVEVTFTTDDKEKVDPNNPDRQTVLADPRNTVHRHLRYTGSITIRDEGVGLSPEAVQDSWLVVSNSIKRVERGCPKPKTAGGRTPLGDKGLGRLGTMRLGDILLLRSARAGSPTINVAWFRWKDCDGAETLDRIPVEVEEHPNSDGFKGTEVVIRGLDDIAAWRSPERAARIACSIASIVSPFEAVETFPVSVTIDGTSYNLESVTNDLLKQAVASYDFRYEVDANGDGVLHSSACFRQDLFKASSNPEAVRRAALVFEKDAGAKFLAWLKKSKFPKGYDEVEFAPTGDCIIQCVDRTPFSKIVKGFKANVANPGSFRGALYYFNFGRRGGAPAGVGASRELVARIGGVAVLRDGFRVRSGDDWLNLARSMTSGSTYHLRFENTTGYFALSGEHNFNLTEKSDREGFVNDEYYRGFEAVAARCRDFANGAQERVRRSLDAYLKEVEVETADAASKSPRDAVELVRKAPQAVSTSAARATMAVDTYRSRIAVLEGADPTTTSADKAEKAIELARKGLVTIESLAKDFEKMRDLAAAGVVVAQEIEWRSEQVAALVESAAVGLAARGLTHELRTHLSEIEQSARAIRAIVRDTPHADKVGRHLRHIDLARRAMSGAASQIDPMLPRTRALKERIVLAEFIEDYFSTRRTEFEREGIGTVIVEEVTGVAVKMNRTRLLQVVDNLMLNPHFSPGLS